MTKQAKVAAGLGAVMMVLGSAMPAFACGNMGGLAFVFLILPVAGLVGVIAFLRNTIALLDRKPPGFFWMATGTVLPVLMMFAGGALFPPVIIGCVLLFAVTIGTMAMRPADTY